MNSTTVRSENSNNHQDSATIENMNNDFSGNRTLKFTSEMTCQSKTLQTLSKCRLLLRSAAEISLSSLKQIDHNANLKLADKIEVNESSNKESKHSELQETVPVYEDLQRPIGKHLLGCLIDSSGNIVSRYPSLTLSMDTFIPINIPKSVKPPHPMARSLIQKPLITGIRAIDGFITIGLGQRIAIFAEPGVGKSSLISAIAQFNNADVSVIALIGERGREVKEFLHESMNNKNQNKPIIVYSTSDESPLSKVNAAQIAIQIAEHFRDCGFNVLLEIDSLTRLIRAYRELGLANGEIPVRRGYPLSVFSKLPELIERTGTNQHGTITALFSVLLSSDFDEDPMVEEIKGLTDGHIMMKKEMASRGLYPAIDVKNSISRLMPKIVNSEHLQNANKVRRLISRLDNDKDTVTFGGTPDEELSFALKKETQIHSFLQQSLLEPCTIEETSSLLQNLAKDTQSKPYS